MNLKEFIDQKKLARDEVAGALGIKKGYLNHIITGARKPSVKLCTKIIDFGEGAITIFDLRPELINGIQAADLEAQSA